MTAPAMRPAQRQSACSRSCDAAFATPLDAILTGVVAVVVDRVRDPARAVGGRRCRVDRHRRTTVARPSGACWAFVGAQARRSSLFGLYPPAERWRAATALADAGRARSWRPRMPRSGDAGCSARGRSGSRSAFWLMHGGAGLERVPTRLWGGLPITLMLTAIGLSLGFPLAVLLALGRRSRSAGPARRWRPRSSRWCAAFR